MITDLGNLSFVDAYNTIYHVEWKKVGDNYEVKTRIDTPFRYGKRGRHTATGQAPFISLFALGTRSEYIQYLKTGEALPISEKTLIDNEPIYVPVSPNSLTITKPFKYDLGFNTMPTDPTTYYCLSGPHFTTIPTLHGEEISLWPIVNIDGSVVPSVTNMVYVDVWNN